MDPSLPRSWIDYVWRKPINVRQCQPFQESPYRVGNVKCLILWVLISHFSSWIQTTVSSWYRRCVMYRSGHWMSGTIVCWVLWRGRRQGDGFQVKLLTDVVPKPHWTGTREELPLVTYRLRRLVTELHSDGVHTGISVLLTHKPQDSDSLDPHRLGL